MNLVYPIIIGCIFFSLGPILVQGQFAATRLYTKADGFPTTEVHRVSTTSEGDLIIAFAPKGVYLYDGEKLSPYLDNLVSDFNLHEIDFANRIWMVQDHNIFCIQSDKVLHWRRKDWEEPYTPQDTIHSEEAIEMGAFLIHRIDQKVYYITAGRTQATPRIYEFIPNKNVWVLKDSTAAFTEQSIREAIQRGNHPNLPLSQNSIEQLSLLNPFICLNGAQPVMVSADNPKHLLFLSNNRIDKIDLPSWASLHQRMDKQTVNRLPNFNSQVLLVQTGTEYHLYEIDQHQKLVRYLKFRFPSNILNVTKDKFDTYWAATHEGLLRIFPQFINFYHKENPNMLNSIHSLIKSPSGKLWFGGYGQGIGFIENEEVHIPFPKKVNVLPGAILDSKGNPLMIGANNALSLRGVIRIDEQNSSLQTISPERIPGYYLTRNLKGELIYGTTGNGIFIQKKENCPADTCWQRLGLSKGFDIGNVISTIQDTLGRYWMVHHLNGIAVYLPAEDTILNYHPPEGAYYPRPFATYRDTNGQLFIGTQQGIAYFTPPDQINNLDEILSWISPIDTTIAQGERFNLAIKPYKEKWLVSSSLSGIHLYDKSTFKNSNPLPVVYSFDYKNGYTGEAGEQNAIWVDESMGEFWFANDHGISKMNFSLMSFEQEPPELIIDKIEGSFTSEPNEIVKVRPENNRDFQILVHIRKTLNPYHSEYYIYQLDKQPKVVKKEGVILLNRIKRGAHRLVITGYRNGIPSPTREINFYIPSPFYQRAWFWVGIGLIALLLPSAIVLYRKNNRRKRQEISNLRIKNLIDNLSPHFLGNSFNWIRNRAKLSGDQEAADIISKMDNIVRTIFQNSRKNRAVHSLKEEIDLLKDYFAIQSVRYDGRHQYIIEGLDPDFPLDDTYIPMMVLQLIAENAIEHGLRNKTDGKGKVWIKLLERENGIEILIEDDGVGRKSAAQMATKTFGESTKMLKELINELNKHNSEKFIFAYDDDIFQTNEGRLYGTRCRIFIPQNYIYELKS